MDSYNSIFYRKSIRNYSKMNLKNGLLDEVEKLADYLDPLDDDIGIHAHIVDRGDRFKLIIRKMFRVIAPYYIVVTSEEKEGYLENVGYTIQKLILDITSLGLATCWVGTQFDKTLIGDIIEIPENEVPVILIAFGYADSSEKLFRSTTEEFKRHSLNSIGKNISRKYKKLLEPVRLSPSAMNSQPWRFYQEGDTIHLYRKKSVIKYVTDYMNKIDIGIALRHFQLSCEYNDKDFDLVKLDMKSKMGKEYCMSINIQDKVLANNC